MHRTVRLLRILLPIVFIGFIVVIAMSWRRQVIRHDKAPTEGPKSASRPHDSIAAESRTFEDTQTVAGREVMHIKATYFANLVSGWNTLENVTLTIYRPKNLTYTLSCPEAQFNSNTKETDAKGGVRLISSDGVAIQSAEMHFAGNRLANHVPVRCRVDRWTGNAGALDLDVQGELLRLFEKIDATMAPETPADAPMHLVAQEGIYRRKENSFDFTNNVVMTRDRDRFNAGHVLGRLAADRP